MCTYTVRIIYKHNPIQEERGIGNLKDAEFIVSRELAKLGALEIGKPLEWCKLSVGSYSAYLGLYSATIDSE